jgi:hypothetical protein
MRISYKHNTDLNFNYLYITILLMVDLDKNNTTYYIKNK